MKIPAVNFLLLSKERMDMKTRKNKDGMGTPNQLTSKTELKPEELENNFYESVIP